MTANIIDATAADGPGILADPTAYTDPRRLKAALARLRASTPVALVDAPEFTATTFVGGLKHLPIRYSLK